MKFEILHDTEDIEICRIKQGEIRKQYLDRAMAAEQAAAFLAIDRSLLGQAVDETGTDVLSEDEELRAQKAGQSIWRLLARGTASLTVSLGPMLIDHRRVAMTVTFCPALNKLRFTWTDPATGSASAALFVEGSTVMRIKWSEAGWEARQALAPVCEALGFTVSPQVQEL